MGMPTTPLAPQRLLPDRLTVYLIHGRVAKLSSTSRPAGQPCSKRLPHSGQAHTPNGKRPNVQGQTSITVLPHVRIVLAAVDEIDQ